MIRVLGVDSSLTGTGLCRTTVFKTEVDDSPTDAEHELATVTTPKPRGGLLDTSRRISHAMDIIEAVILEEPLDLIVLEELAYSAGNSSAHKLGWVWGRVIDLAVRHNVRLVKANTAAVKKYATGKGNAKKDVVMLAMANRFNDAGIADNNQADAMVCALIGCRFLGVPVDTMPKLNLEAMAKIVEET